MNKKISWDQSLVKKYSSSNHFKMLNQLRNEVKKYPLNKKKDINKKIINSTNNETKINKNKSISQNLPLINNSNISNEFNINKSTVSFNNSKDFSIYKNINVERQEIKSSDQKTSTEDICSSTFNDRLNKIDLN